MLQRILARGRALRQICNTTQSSSRSIFTALSKPDAMTRSLGHMATRRSEAGWIHRPRAMMSSSLARTTCLDDGFPCDIDFDYIKSHMTCSKFHDTTWGLVVRRTPQYLSENGPKSAWDRMLQALRRELQESLRYYIREDLLQFHDLHVIDDKALYGATSHQVREHFQSWSRKSLQGRLRPDATDLKDDIGWHYATSTPRYEYCLFADDICLESMDQSGCDMPVVKILCRDWESPWSPEEMSQPVPAPFHDGFTEYDEEDVGWMYMSLNSYMDKYDLLGRINCDWYDQYVRPPYIDGSEDETNVVGYWRQESSKQEADK